MKIIVRMNFSDLNFALNEYVFLYEIRKVKALKFRYEKKATEAVFVFAVLFTKSFRHQRIA